MYFWLWGARVPCTCKVQDGLEVTMGGGGGSSRSLDFFFLYNGRVSLS